MRCILGVSGFGFCESQQAPQKCKLFFVPKKRVCLPLCHYGNLLSDETKAYLLSLGLYENHNILENWIPTIPVLKFAIDDLTFGGALE